MTDEQIPNAVPVGPSTHRWAVVAEHGGGVDIVSHSTPRDVVARELREIADQLDPPAASPAWSPKWSHRMIEPGFYELRRADVEQCSVAMLDDVRHQHERIVAIVAAMQAVEDKYATPPAGVTS